MSWLLEGFCKSFSALLTRTSSCISSRGRAFFFLFLVAMVRLASGGTPSAHLISWGNMSLPYVEPGTVFTNISAGRTHNMAIDSQGNVISWGGNIFSAIFHGQAITPGGLSNIVAVASGWAHSVALKNNGMVIGWGEPTSANPPAGLSNIVNVAAGGRHSLALKSDGTITGWGDNSYGQRTSPPGLSNVVGMAGGGEHSIVLRGDGTIVCWGRNDRGQATAPPGLTNVLAVAAGELHS